MDGAPDARARDHEELQPSRCRTRCVDSKVRRTNAGDVIERYLADQSSSSRYWPDDGELREELAVLLAYRTLGRGRLRMVLEAIEDHSRGWRDGKSGLGDERVARGKPAIEHVMPRKWHPHWPLKGRPRSGARPVTFIHLGILRC